MQIILVNVRITSVNRNIFRQANVTFNFIIYR